MKARFNTALFALTAVVAALALAAPTPASAHQADAHHQHGWSSNYLLWFGNFGSPLRCVPTYSDPFNGRVYPGSVTVYFPDVITSPTPTGGLSRVWFTARLEQWTGSSWYTIPDNTPWVYALANQGGLQGWYTSNNLLLQASTPTFGWDAGKGYYRVHLYYSWAADGTTFYNDVTNWCEV